jgi:hypothetical protein
MKRALRFGLIVAEGRADVAAARRRGLTLRSFQTVCRSRRASTPINRLTFRIGLPGARYQGSRGVAAILRRARIAIGR